MNNRAHRTRPKIAASVTAKRVCLYLRYRRWVRRHAIFWVASPTTDHEETGHWPCLSYSFSHCNMSLSGNFILCSTKSIICLIRKLLSLIQTDGNSIWWYQSDYNWYISSWMSMCVILYLGQWISKIQIKLPAISHLVCTQKGVCRCEYRGDYSLPRSVCSEP